MFFEYGRYKNGNRYGVRYHIENIYENNRIEAESRELAKNKIENFVQRLFPRYSISVVKQEFHQPRYPFTCVMWIDTLFQLNEK